MLCRLIGKMIESNILAVLMCAVTLRLLVAQHGYSGNGMWPMFGDYEAQRHWMEITVNLPIDEWYFNSTQNDLNYWGLDYPPLTAYHSWLCGVVARYVNPDFVTLFESRGFESYDHKIFMRMTVLIADLVTFISACVYFVRTEKLNNVYLLVILTYPGLILIDHGHFQYNCVSLGLAVFAITALLKDQNVLACIGFVLALSYKQMLLYYAFPFFFYFLGKSFEKFKQKPRLGLLELSKYAITVVLTFAVVWAPFLSHRQLPQVLHRIFPVARGLFEDKVSNVWCVLNLLYKFKLNILPQKMAIVCLITTLTASLPSSLNVFLYPRKTKFLLSLINCSLAFFLFSFQVHEKTILVVAAPVLLFFKNDPVISSWFLFISVFSMSPLLLKDSLIGSFIALTGIFGIVLSSVFTNFHELPRKQSKLLQFIIFLSLFGCVILFFILTLTKPSSKYPDLGPLLVSVYSALHFIGFYLYFNYRQLSSLKVRKYEKLSAM